jgi:hypothetical protein
MGGIFDALATGNLKLAGEIAMAGLLVAWDAGFNQIKAITAAGISAVYSAVFRGVAAIGGGLNSILSTVTQAVSGIFDAIASGNLGLAGEIAMAGLSLAWSGEASAAFSRNPRHGVTVTSCAGEAIRSGEIWSATRLTSW